MPRILDRLGLVYNFACPLQCDFCCHPPEEYGHAKMDPGTVVNWLYQASQIDTVVDVAITGGEPFLYYEEIVSIWEQLGKNRLPFRIVTSAVWGRDFTKACEKLKTLKSLGLNLLGVSYDDSHAKFVERKTVENVLRAADDLEIPCQVVGNFWQKSRSVQDLLTIPTNHFFEVESSHVFPIGRAADAGITPESHGIVPELSKFKCIYRKNFYDIAIYPDGELYPCCSGGFQVKGKLSVGNLNKTPLQTLLDRAHADVYVRIVKEKTFQFLYDLVRERRPKLFPGLPKFENMVTGCQLCQAIHGDDRLMEELQPLLDEYEVTYVQEELRNIMNVLNIPTTNLTETGGINERIIQETFRK